VLGSDLDIVPGLHELWWLDPRKILFQQHFSHFPVFTTQENVAWMEVWQQNMTKNINTITPLKTVHRPALN
jgi:hypothetical protein